MSSANGVAHQQPYHCDPLADCEAADVPGTNLLPDATQGQPPVNPPAPEGMTEAGVSEGDVAGSRGDADPEAPSGAPRLPPDVPGSESRRCEGGAASDDGIVASPAVDDSPFHQLTQNVVTEVLTYLDSADDVLTFRLVSRSANVAATAIPWKSLFDLEFDDWEDEEEEAEESEEEELPCWRERPTPEELAAEARARLDGVEALWRERFVKRCSHAGTGAQPFLTYGACHFDFTNDEREVLSFRCSLMDARSFKAIDEYYAYILPPSGCSVATLKQNNLLPPTIKHSALASQGKPIAEVLRGFHDFLRDNGVLVGNDDASHPLTPHPSNDLCSPLVIRAKYATEQEMEIRPFQKFAMLVGDDCTGRTLAEHALVAQGLRRYLTAWCNLKDIFGAEYGKKARSLEDILQHFALEGCSSKQRRPAHKGLTSRQACRNLCELSRQIARDGFKLPITRIVKL